MNASVKKDILTALRDVKRARLLAEPERPRGGMPKILNSIRDDNVIYFLRAAGVSLFDSRRASSAKKAEVLAHVLEAQSMLATMFSIKEHMQFEEPAANLDEIIEYLEGALEALEG